MALKSQVIQSANLFLNRLDFESMTNCLLDYLHSKPITEEPSGLSPLIHDKLSIMIPCGGLSSRWNASFLPRKHILDLGDGVPLIERTIQQLARTFPQSLCSIIDSDSHDSAVANNYDHFCQQIPLINKPSDPVGIEILENSLGLSSHSGRSLLWLYGDVCFTWEALQAIASQIALNPNSLCFFGRKHPNEAFANSGGEIFGAYVPVAMKEWLLHVYRFIERLAIGMPLPRVSTWEVVSYLSLFKHDSLELLPPPSIIRNDTQLTCNLMSETFSKRSFNPAIWVEINDETEDFDYSFEYIRRLYWLALR
ncbi:hypothetical protein [Synechococcus sp. LTW-G]